MYARPLDIGHLDDVDNETSRFKASFGVNLSKHGTHRQRFVKGFVPERQMQKVNGPSNESEVERFNLERQLNQNIPHLKN